MKSQRNQLVSMVVAVGGTAALLLTMAAASTWWFQQRKQKKLRRGTETQKEEQKEAVNSSILQAVVDHDLALLKRLVEEEGGDPCVWSQGEGAESETGAATQGVNPLMLAAQDPDAEPVASYLLGLPSVVAQINAQGDQKLSALHHASFFGNMEMVRNLVKLGADPNLEDETHHRPIDYAVQEGHAGLLQFFLAQGANPNRPSGGDIVSLLYDAANRGHTATVQVLLSYKKGTGDISNMVAVNPPPPPPAADGDLLKKRKRTPLMAACLNGHEEVVGVLLHHGADVNLEADNDDLTALHLAVYSTPQSNSSSSTNDDMMMTQKKIKIVSRLLEAGASINHLAGKGITCLHRAALQGNVELVKLLLKQKDINVNCRGLEPAPRAPALHFAAAGGSLDVVKLFVAAGADLDLENETPDQPKNARQAAAAKGHHDIVLFLEGQRKKTTADY